MQSHHSGIENEEALSRWKELSAGCNRTIVGLKVVKGSLLHICSKLQSHHSGIESTNLHSFALKTCMLQSHHSGIESEASAVLVQQVACSCNRTIVGLKGRALGARSDRLEQLQSHHSGIERRFDPRTPEQLKCRLQSHHSGIERCHTLTLTDPPLWLQSHHSGIERYKNSHIPKIPHKVAIAP